MEQLVETIASSKSETLWHRDILFKYFLTMEQLQENMKEYQELMNLAGMFATTIDLLQSPISLFYVCNVIPFSLPVLISNIYIISGRFTE